MAQPGNGEDHVTWAQLERELGHLREARELHERELSRRLDILNGEAERLRTDRAESVRRETFEQWRDGVNRDLTDLKAGVINVEKMAEQESATVERNQRRFATIAAAIGLLIGLVVNYLRH